MNRLSLLCKKSYPFLEKALPILNYIPNTDPLHNKRMIAIREKSMNTFDGKNHSDSVNYLLDYFLKENGYQNTLTVSNKGNFTTKETHSYLTNGHFIIDPTYRQMLLPNYSKISNVSGSDLYHTYLFQYLPMTYIGTYEELASLHHKLSKLHYNVYNCRLESKLSMWRDGIDQSVKSDFDKVLNSLEYAAQKGGPYIKLHTMFYHCKDKYI